MMDTDLRVHDRLSRAINGVRIDVDDRLTDLLWRGTPPPRHRAAAAIVALAVAVAGLGFGAMAFLRSSSTVGAGEAAQSILFERNELIVNDMDFPNPEIWSVGEDGSGARPLPQPPGNNTKPEWSPDGTRIAFVGQEGVSADTSTLWLMDADGDGLTPIVEGFSVDEPAWSPDGLRIAFVGQQDPAGEPAGPLGLWIVPVDGGDPRLVLEGAWEGPGWSPDGTRLVVVGWRGNDVRDLYTVNVDGSGLIRITGGGASWATPAWSPDGTRIACSRWDGESAVNVYVMNANGSDVRQLTDRAGWDSLPIWSADGSRILFASDRGAIGEDGGFEGGVADLGIYVMNADGSGVQLVYREDGRQLVATSWNQ
jgi:Tol biopolymer transport system component